MDGQLHKRPCQLVLATAARRSGARQLRGWEGAGIGAHASSLWSCSSAQRHTNLHVCLNGAFAENQKILIELHAALFHGNDYGGTAKLEIP